MSQTIQARPRLYSSTALALVLLAGCGHSDPFPSGNGPDLGPRTEPLPRQLTYSLNDDVQAAWSADGSMLVYSYVDEVAPHDRCLGLLPAGGGTRMAGKCLVAAPDHDTAKSLTWPSFSPDGRIGAWVETRQQINHRSPDASLLRVGVLATGDTGIGVTPLPYLAPSGKVHWLATHIGWLGPRLLVYVGSDVLYPASTIVGLEVATLDFSVQPAVIRVVPNTDSATSVCPTPDGQAIYYTLARDTRIFRQVLASGAIDVVYDFAGQGVPDDVWVGGGLLGVVLARAGQDREVIRVDLAQSLSQVFPVEAGTPTRAAFSPDGRRIAVQVFDTVANPANANLYLTEPPAD